MTNIVELEARVVVSVRPTEEWNLRIPPTSFADGIVITGCTPNSELPFTFDVDFNFYPPRFSSLGRSSLQLIALAAAALSQELDQRNWGGMRAEVWCTGP